MVDSKSSDACLYRWLNGADPVADAGRFLEQQPWELSHCVSQLQRPRQPQQQSRFSGGLRLLVSTPHSSELVEGIRSGVHGGVQSAPVMGMASSENQTGPDGLVGFSKNRPAHPEILA